METTARPCDHWFVHGGMCCHCGSAVDKANLREFRYYAKGIMLSQGAVEDIRRKASEQGLSQKKLYLVLDLDHTLVHSLAVPNICKAEKYLMGEAGRRDDLWRISFKGYGEMLVKLRPFAREFLREASRMFTMYVYTMGAAVYAEAVVKLLDPEGEYFGERVITRRESGERKSLDLVLAEERHVVVVDNTREVWPNHGSNLLEIMSYDYFTEPGSNNPFLRCYAKDRSDESAASGALASKLDFLKTLHSQFFHQSHVDSLSSRDVRALLSKRTCF